MQENDLTKKQTEILQMIHEVVDMCTKQYMELPFSRDVAEEYKQSIKDEISIRLKIILKEDATK